MPKSQKRCEEIRSDMRNKIIRESMLYFAKNGFAGTKISDLSKHIGIGQGTIYVYFKSKEELFCEIQNLTNQDKEISQLKLLSGLPVTAVFKVHQLTRHIFKQFKEDSSFAGIVALNTQLMLEQDIHSATDATTYQSELYRYTAAIIEQGQKEKSVVSGNPMKLADYYWGVVYVYALKQLFTTRYEMISPEDLERTILIGKAADNEEKDSNHNRGKRGNRKRIYETDHP